MALKMNRYIFAISYLSYWMIIGYSNSSHITPRPAGAPGFPRPAGGEGV